METVASTPWTAPARVNEGPQARLLADHARLEKLFEQLVDAFDAGAIEDTQALWSELDASLERHFRAEEDLLFPLFARVAPEEVAELLREHVRIRLQLDELGAGVDLKLVRAEVAREFIDTLRAHARRENALLYRWAETAPATTRDELAERLDF